MVAGTRIFRRAGLAARALKFLNSYKIPRVALRVLTLIPTLFSQRKSTLATHLLNARRSYGNINQTPDMRRRSEKGLL